MDYSAASGELSTRIAFAFSGEQRFKCAEPPCLFSSSRYPWLQESYSLRLSRVNCPASSSKKLSLMSQVGPKRKRVTCSTLGLAVLPHIDSILLLTSMLLTLI